MRPRDLYQFMLEVLWPVHGLVTLAAVAGGTAALHISGHSRASTALSLVKVGAVLAASGFCAWCFFRKPPSGDAGALPRAAPKRDAVSIGQPEASELCCGGGCDEACESEKYRGAHGEDSGDGGDLEDLHSSDDEAKSMARMAARVSYTLPKTARNRAFRLLQEETEKYEDTGISTAVTPMKTDGSHGEGVFLPGRAKVYFKTFGCSHNVSDSEYMQGLLYESGYRLVDTLDEADVCVINSCTVKSPSEFALYSAIKAALGITQTTYGHGRMPHIEASFPDPTGSSSPENCSADDRACEADCSASSGVVRRFEEGLKQQDLQQAQRPRRRIPCVVAGCVPGAIRAGYRGLGSRKSYVSWQEALLEQCSVVGVSRISRIVEVVEEALQGRIVRLTGGKGLPPLDLPKIRRNRLIEIVPISMGCLGNCTYCKTKHARGELGSYPEEAIEARVRSALEQGAKQIWLTSEDTGAYGLDIGSSLTKLLRRLLNLPLGEEVMLRVGMGNPPFLLGQLAAATELLGHPNMFEFLQLPVQSGSNRVLSRMKRDYTVEQFRTVVDACLKAHPKMSIMTDVICGFPGETEEDHQQTLQLLSDYRFPAVNISQFYPRPGTPAAAMKQLPSQIVKRRSREVTHFFESYTCYDWMVGTIQKVHSLWRRVPQFYAERDRRKTENPGSFYVAAIAGAAVDA